MRTVNTSNAIGGKAATAKSYWDRMLSVEEVAMVLGMRISLFKEAVRLEQDMYGLPAPKPTALSSGDKMFFDGRDIEKLVTAKSGWARASS